MYFLGAPFFIFLNALVAYATSSQSTLPGKTDKSNPRELCEALRKPTGNVSNDQLATIARTWTKEMMLDCPIGALRIDLHDLNHDNWPVWKIIDLFDSLLPLIKGDPLAEATLLLRLDCLLHDHITIVRVRSYVQALDILNQLLTFRARALAAVGPIVAKSAVDFTMPIIQEFTSDPATLAAYQWIATEADYDRYRLWATFNEASLCLLDTAFKLRSMLGVANCLYVLPSRQTVVFDRLLGKRRGDNNLVTRAITICAVHAVFSAYSIGDVNDNAVPPLYLLPVLYPTCMRDAGTRIGDMLHEGNTSSSQAFIQHAFLPVHLRIAILRRLAQLMRFQERLVTVYQQRHGIALGQTYLAPLAQQVCDAPLQEDPARRDDILIYFINEHIGVLEHCSVTSDMQNLITAVQKCPETYASLIQAVNDVLAAAGRDHVAFFQLICFMAANELASQPSWVEKLHKLGASEPNGTYVKLAEDLRSRMALSEPSLVDQALVATVYHGEMADYLRFFRPLLVAFPVDLANAEGDVYKNARFDAIDEGFRRALPGLALADFSAYQDVKLGWQEGSGPSRFQSMKLLLRLLAILVRTSSRTWIDRQHLTRLADSHRSARLEVQLLRETLDAKPKKDNQSQLPLARAVTLETLVKLNIQPLVSGLLLQLAQLHGFRMRHRVTSGTLLTIPDPKRGTVATLQSANAVSIAVSVANSFNMALGRPPMLDLHELETRLTASSGKLPKNAALFETQYFGSVHTATEQIAPWVRVLRAFKFSGTCGGRGGANVSFGNVLAKNDFGLMAGFKAVDSDVEANLRIDSILQMHMEGALHADRPELNACLLGHWLMLLLCDTADTVDIAALKPIVPTLVDLHKALFATPAGLQALVDLAARIPFFDHQLLVEPGSAAGYVYRALFLRHLYRHFLSQESMQDLERRDFTAANGNGLMGILLRAVDKRDLTTNRHNSLSCPDCDVMKRTCLNSLYESRASFSRLSCESINSLKTTATMSCMVARYARRLLLPLAHPQIAFMDINLRAHTGTVSITDSIDNPPYCEDPEVQPGWRGIRDLCNEVLPSALRSEQLLRQVVLAAETSATALQAIASVQLRRQLMGMFGLEAGAKHWEILNLNALTRVRHSDDLLLLIALQSSSHYRAVVPLMAQLATANGLSTYEQHQAHYLRLLAVAFNNGEPSEYMRPWMEGRLEAIANVRNGIFRSWLPRFLLDLHHSNLLVEVGSQLLILLTDIITCNEGIHDLRHARCSSDDDDDDDDYDFLCLPCLHDVELMKAMVNALLRNDDQVAVEAAKSVLGCLQSDLAASALHIKIFSDTPSEPIAAAVRDWLHHQESQSS